MMVGLSGLGLCTTGVGPRSEFEKGSKLIELSIGIGLEFP